MTTKNKFAHEPFIPNFSSEYASKLKEVLTLLFETCCKHFTCEGAIFNLDELMCSPSLIRKVDLPTMNEVVKAINGLEKIIEG